MYKERERKRKRKRNSHTRVKFKIKTEKKIVGSFKYGCALTLAFTRLLALAIVINRRLFSCKLIVRIVIYVHSNYNNCNGIVRYIVQELM